MKQIKCGAVGYQNEDNHNCTKRREELTKAVIGEIGNMNIIQLEYLAEIIKGISKMEA